MFYFKKHKSQNYQKVDVPVTNLSHQLGIEYFGGYCYYYVFKDSAL